MPAHYDWQRHYEAAIVETDHSKLPGLIQAALAAINARLEQMRLDHGGTLEEEQAIADALSGIRVLQKEINEA